MHGILWLLETICIAVAGLLFILVLEGISIFGLSVQVQTVIAVAAVAAAVIAALLLYKGVQANLLKVKTGREALIGARGQAVTDLNPNGEVRVMSEYWRAKAKNDWISKGEEVEVTEMEGLFLIVKAAKEKV